MQVEPVCCHSLVQHPFDQLRPPRRPGSRRHTPLRKELIAAIFDG